jgi:hypothetical protein
MTAAAWPRTLEIPPDARRQWAILREALAVSEPPCAAAPDVWHSRAAADIEAAVDACHGCHAFTACDSYATTANEATGVWAGRDRAAKQSKGKTA